VENIEELIMGESCTYSLDLVSEKRCQDHMLEDLEGKIRSIPFDYPEIAESICSVLSINQEGKIEIYIEDNKFNEDCSDSLVDFIVKIELIIGQFDYGSSLKWEVEFPFTSRTWVKDNYQWELSHSEEDNYYDGDNWSDPEWDDWEN
jgi:hypothetical protein